MNYPPQMPHHMKESWEVQLRGQVASTLKRKQAPVTGNPAAKRRSLEGTEQEMDISDGGKHTHITPLENQHLGINVE